MKPINKIISLIVLLAVAFGFAACSPDDYRLGEMGLSKEDLNVGKGFEIKFDKDNQNIVTLKSLLPKMYLPLWDHPQGRAQGDSVVLKIPFAGDYSCRMGVETPGGIVYGDTARFTIDSFNAAFVNDPLWTYITGGVGKKKRWYLDVDAKGQCRYFVGPVYFYGMDDSWETVMLGQTVAGDSWTWAADWAGNSWVLNDGAKDYGYMEFSLDNGASVTVYDAINGKTATGKFMLDATNHTLKMTDAEMLHDPSGTSKSDNWSSMKLLALDENHMQLAVVRKEDPCLLSYNFISEEYRDNWTPDAPSTDVTPTLQADWRDYVEPKTQNIVTYKMAEDDVPYDWCNLDGTQKGDASTVANAELGNLTLTMNHKEGTYTVSTPSGQSVEGKYSLTSDGIYTFDKGLPVVQLSTNGAAMFKANADNTLRIMQVAVDEQTGGLSDIWLGSAERDDQGNVAQYMGYHFQPYVAGQQVKKYAAKMYSNDNVSWTLSESQSVSVTSEGDYTFTINGSNMNGSAKIIYLQVDKILRDHPNADLVVKSIKVDGKSVAFDDSKIARSIDDGSAPTAKYNARRYFCNPWGANYFAPEALDFNSSLEVTITVKFDVGKVVIPDQTTK